MALRRAIGAVKDQTSIGLAKVGNSNSLADLDVAIVKATRHEEYPPEDKYFREIVSLTCYSRTYISACVNTLSRRLSKTKNWVVALKTLMLIQRLLTEGDPAYEQEIFFTTRRGTRLLNMSDFRDTSRSNSWDYSAFVRTYASYLDDKLEFKMQGIRKKHTSCSHSFEEEELPEEYASASATSIKTTPIREQLAEHLLPKMQLLQQLLERFLATRPAGLAKHSRIVIISMCPIVKESFQIYYDITDILSTLIDQFMELEISDCVNVLDIFCRISKQFDELDAYYKWCKEVGIARASEYPEVERITPKKLDLMEEFIKEKAANAQNRLAIMGRQEHDDNETDSKDHQQEEVEVVEDINAIKALPPPEGFQEQDDIKEEEKPGNKKKEELCMEADFLNLGDDAPRLEEHADKLALALFDNGEVRNSNTRPIWEEFNDKSDWETSLVESSSYLAQQRVSLGGGFDTMLLDGMYQQGALNAALVANRVGGTGSASSVAFGTVGNPHLLALPAPPTSSSSSSTGNTENVDPFAASLGVAPPAYVQMSEMEKKQRLLVQEQLYWQQYQRDRMQGPTSLSNMQSTPPPHMGGGYPPAGYRF